MKRAPLFSSPAFAGEVLSEPFASEAEGARPAPSPIHFPPPSLSLRSSDTSPANAGEEKEF